jgi:hypothetical protein
MFHITVLCWIWKIRVSCICCTQANPSRGLMWAIIRKIVFLMTQLFHILVKPNTVSTLADRQRHNYALWRLRNYMRPDYNWAPVRELSRSSVRDTSPLNLHFTCRPVYRSLFSLAAHPNLSKIHDGTPQNFASRKGGTKLCMAINMCLHINPCPFRVQTYKNRT